MKILGYCPLLYGKEYLRYSIESYKYLVDKIIILYSPIPSYGHNTHLVCPESEHDLKDIAFSTSSKVEWIRVKANQEGQHRAQIFKYADSYDLILGTDYDEVWDKKELAFALKEAYDNPFERYGINGFINFWKDFNNVCIDSFRPIRIIKPGGVGESEVKVTCYHFGYAISEEMMRWKWAIHGHHNELRDRWIEDVYLGDRKDDLHPVAIGLWNAQPFDKHKLPDILQSHPRF